MSNVAKQVCLLQHAEDTPPGLLGEWLLAREIEHSIVRLHDGEELPRDPREFAGLAILGSEHSATQAEPAWIPGEVALVRRAVSSEVPVLGICFGGQILSLAMGGEVRASASPSIGWHPVEPRSLDGASISAGPWLHFHYEVFSVPEHATELASSPGGPSAFAYGPHLAVQFHPEATVEIVEDWAGSDAERLARLDCVPDGLALTPARERERARRDAFHLFDAWLPRASGA